MDLHISRLHESALAIVRSYSKIESGLLEILQKLDEHQVYLHLGCTSLFQYCVSKLGLSESVALNFINVARKSREVPRLQEKIRAGTISVSKARKIVPVLKKENADQWIEMAKVLPQKKLEQEVARVAPQASVHEQMKYISESRMKFTLGIGEELAQKLKRAQDLESQRQMRAVSFEDALGVLAEGYLEKHDPVRKAERSLFKKKSATSPSGTSPISTSSASGPMQDQSNRARGSEQPVARQVQKVQSTQRTPIPAAVRHEVQLRDQGRCVYLEEERSRCGSTRWLDIHHVQPVEQGGSNTLENLATLCHAHHRIVHFRNEYSPDFFTAKVTSHREVTVH